MTRVLLRVRGIFITLARQGLLHTLYLVYIYTVSPYIVIVCLWAVSKRNKLRIAQRLFLNRRFSNWNQKKDEILKWRHSGYLSKLDDLGLSVEQLQAIRELQELKHEVLIAEIDQDGFLLSKFGAIGNLPMVSEVEFVERKKYRLRITAVPLRDK